MLCICRAYVKGDVAWHDYDLVISIFGICIRFGCRDNPSPTAWVRCTSGNVYSNACKQGLFCEITTFCLILPHIFLEGRDDMQCQYVDNTCKRGNLEFIFISHEFNF